MSKKWEAVQFDRGPAVVWGETRALRVLSCLRRSGTSRLLGAGLGVRPAVSLSERQTGE